MLTDLQGQERNIGKVATYGYTLDTAASRAETSLVWEVPSEGCCGWRLENPRSGDVLGPRAADHP